MASAATRRSDEDMARAMEEAQAQAQEQVLLDRELAEGHGSSDEEEEEEEEGYGGGGWSVWWSDEEEDPPPRQPQAQEEEEAQEEEALRREEFLQRLEEPFGDEDADFYGCGERYDNPKDPDYEPSPRGGGKGERKRARSLACEEVLSDEEEEEALSDEDEEEEDEDEEPVEDPDGERRKRRKRNYLHAENGERTRNNAPALAGSDVSTAPDAETARPSGVKKLEAYPLFVLLYALLTSPPAAWVANPALDRALKRSLRSTDKLGGSADKHCRALAKVLSRRYLRDPAAYASLLDDDAAKREACAKAAVETFAASMTNPKSRREYVRYCRTCLLRLERRMLDDRAALREQLYEEEDPLPPKFASLRGYVHALLADGPDLANLPDA